MVFSFFLSAAAESEETWIWHLEKELLASEQYDGRLKDLVEEIKLLNMGQEGRTHRCQQEMLEFNIRKIIEVLLANIVYRELVENVFKNWIMESA